MSLMSYEKGLEILLASVLPYEKVEKIALTECLGRILACDISANDDYPAFATASMDGYAVRFAEQENALKIIGSVPAGTLPKYSPKENECVKTFTGSLMSTNLDTLVPVENVSVENDTLKINQKVPFGFAVRGVGESYKKGEILLKKGTKLGFSELALLAELGFFHISVFIKPVIGVLSSGDELKDLGESLDNPAQIRSSNHIAIASLARSFGARAIIFPLLKDERHSVKPAIANALESCDILITTGGVSMGDFDFLKAAVREYELIIDKLDIKPGRHIKVAKSGKKFILAFPGFPYSSMVAFHLTARQILNSWLCQKNDFVIKAFLKGAYSKKSPFFEFVACNVEFENGKVCVNLKDKKQGSSAIISNLNQNSALMLVPKECQRLENGDLVSIMLLS